MNNDKDPDHNDYGTFTWGNRQPKPLDKYRGWGLVFMILTFLSFLLGTNSTGVLQTGAMICCMISGLTILVLMSKSIDQQNEEVRRRRRR